MDGGDPTKLCVCGVSIPAWRKGCGKSACYNRVLRQALPQLAERECLVCKTRFQPKSVVNTLCGSKRCTNRRAYDLDLGIASSARKGTWSAKPTEATCAECGGVFVPITRKNLVCPKPECRAKATKKAQHRRFARWYATHADHVAQKGKARRKKAQDGTAALPPAAPPVLPAPTDPWATAAPNFAAHLPGVGMALTLSPPRTVSLRQARALHAIVTKALDAGHLPSTPTFTLVHTDVVKSGWGVYVDDAERGRALAGAWFDGSILGAKVRVTFGPSTWKMRAPQVAATGRTRVRVSAITPVVTRCTLGDRESASYQRPSAVAFGVSLVQMAKRLGLDVDLAQVGVRVVSSATTVEHVATGKIGSGLVRGWVGDVVVDVNPLARWLLEGSTTLGLGGRTAFGFGRVRVVEVATEDGQDLPPPPAPAPEDMVGQRAEEQAARLLGLPAERARLHLVQAIERASFVEAMSNGCEIWQDGELRMVLRRGPLSTPQVTAVLVGDRPLKAGVVGAPVAKERFYVTPYAVQRYVERVAMGTPLERAREELDWIVSAGRFVGSYKGRLMSLGGMRGPFELWRGPRLGTMAEARAKSRVRFVVGRSDADPTRLAVVTVLPRSKREEAVDGRRDARAA